MEFMIAAGVLVLLLVVFGFIYNSLVKLNVQSEEAWSDITVQLKRRYDLIPNLVNTVQGYAGHEKSVFQDITTARANAMNAQGVADTAKAENQFTETMKSLFAVAEAYPDLKATQNFQDLQTQLTDTEDKIQASRRFYNGVVRDFNTQRTVFPISMVASVFGFKSDKVFFELEEAENASVAGPVKVKF